MGFLDLFRPKWRHSDPEVRAEAVRQLDPDNVATLTEVARTDPDSRVRKIAVKVLDDPRVLKEIAKSDADDGLRAAAAQKASELLTAAALGGGPGASRAVAELTEARDLAAVVRRATDEAIGKAALGRIDDAKVLADLALRAERADLRLAALAKVHDVTLLGDIAVETEHKAVALAVLERHLERDVLDRIARDARSKAARTAARGKLPTQEMPLRAAGVSPAEQKAKRARLLQLCLQAEALSKSSDWDDAAAGLADAKARWDELGAGPADKTLAKRFEGAFAHFQTRREGAERDARARAAAAQEAAAKKAKKAAEAKAEAERKAVAAAAPPPPVAAAPEPAPAPEPEPAPAPAPELSREERLTAICISLESLAGPPRAVDAKLAELDDRWKELDTEAEPAPEALKLRMTAARDAIVARRRAEDEARAAEVAARVKELEKAAARLEKALEGNDRKNIENAQKSAIAILKNKRPSGEDSEKEVRARLSTALDRVAPKLTELRDVESWKGWANLPKLEEICKEAEALAEVVDTVEDKRRAPAVLKELQERWRRAAAGAPRGKAQELGERFKKACDLVHDRCREFFAKLDTEKATNLTKKEELCVKAEALSGSSDWKATAEELKRLQAEWKAVGPVPQEKSEEIWKRFRGACDAFFTRRDAESQERDVERAENLQKKVALCEQAEALATSTDWKETARQIKALQEDWQAIGPAPREQADEVWKRFRAACDRFFDARKEAFAKADDERAGNLAKKEALCAKAEALADAEDHDEAMEAAKALMAEWKTIGHVPRDVSDAIWARFRAACDKVFEEPAIPPAVAASQAVGIAGFVNRLPLEGLAEKLAAASGKKPEPAPAAEAKPAPAAEPKADTSVDEGWDEPA